MKHHPLRFSGACALKIASAFLIGLSTVSAQKPFPQGLNWPGCIKPSGVAQSTMNSDITSIYDKFKANYFTAGDQTGEFYSYAQGNPPDPSIATVSEQHGYVMILTALMAGYDDSAKIYFDGMDAVRRRFPSSQNSACMSWQVDLNGGTLSASSDGATDGDMDMAYALLLADAQWGGSPAGQSTTYLDEAKTLINALHGGGNTEEISSTSYRTILGDWGSDPLCTRSSDWMVDHMRAYKAATGDAFWDKTETAVYTVISDLTGPGKPGASTGLVPDFSMNDPAVPDASGGGTKEKKADCFSWNGCRYPWRMAMAYQHCGSTQAKAAVENLLDWATVETNGDPATFEAGYDLTGKALVSGDIDLAFIGPITTAATVDSKYQSFLDKGWAYVSDIANYGNDSYDDAIGLMCLLSISGNWWAPGSSSPTTNFTITSTITGKGGTITPKGAAVVASGGSQSYSVSASSGKQIDSVKVDDVLQDVTDSSAFTYNFTGVTSNHTIAAWCSALPVSGIRSTKLSLSVLSMAGSSSALSLCLPTAGHAILSIYTTNGKLCRRIDRNFAGGTNAVSLSNLASGVYLAKLSGVANLSTRFAIFR